MTEVGQFARKRNDDVLPTMYGHGSGMPLIEEGRVNAGAEPPDEVERLRNRRAEHVRDVERIGARIELPPRLRDRNKFFNWLLNGELDTYARVRPQWREHQRLSREVDRLKAEIEAVIRRRVMAEPGYRALVAKTHEEADLKRSCVRLLGVIRQARSRVNGAGQQAEVSPSEAVREAQEVARRLHAVRQQAEDVNTKVANRRPFAASLAELGLGLPGDGDRKERTRHYDKVAASLDSVERTARTLIREIAEREDVVRAKRRQYLKDGQARYGQ